MRNILLKYLYLFYRYYDKGRTKNIAYESSILALQLVLALNLYTFLIAIGLGDYLIFKDGRSKIWKYVFVFLFICLPGYWILKKIFKREDFVEIEMSKSEIRWGYILIIAYIVLSLELFFAVAG